MTPNDFPIFHSVLDTESRKPTYSIGILDTGFRRDGEPILNSFLELVLPAKRSSIAKKQQKSQAEYISGNARTKWTIQ